MSEPPPGLPLEEGEDLAADDISSTRTASMRFAPPHLGRGGREGVHLLSSHAQKEQRADDGDGDSCPDFFVAGELSVATEKQLAAPGARIHHIRREAREKLRHIGFPRFVIVAEHLLQTPAFAHFFARHINEKENQKRQNCDDLNWKVVQHARHRRESDDKKKSPQIKRVA